MMPRYSQYQYVALNEVFQQTHYVDAGVKMALAETGLTDRQISYWFATKRHKLSRASNGGSSISAEKSTQMKGDESGSENELSSPNKLSPKKWFKARVSGIKSQTKYWKKNEKSFRDNSAIAEEIELAIQKRQEYETIEEEVIKRRHLVNIVKSMNTEDRPILQRTYDDGETPEADLRRFILGEKSKNPAMVSTAMAKVLPPDEHEIYQRILNDENDWNAYFSNRPSGTYRVPWSKLDLSYHNHCGLRGIGLAPKRKKYKSGSNLIAKKSRKG